MTTTILTPSVSKKTTWVLDSSNSELIFKVKHLMIANVKGSFRKFNAEINGNDFTTAKIRTAIDASSIDTNDDSRDGHLKSGDFFDVVKYPELTFEGKSMKKINEENYILTGLLTIKGISKEVVLDVEYGGINTDPWGNEKAGFTVEGRINRKNWGLNWNAALETGGVLVSDEVKISAELQFVKK